MPHPDSPIQDPYLGRRLLHAFDLLIPPAMDVNARIAAWTHGKGLSRLQRAACEIVPSGFSIALSIRELIRAGYLFSADILLRPLLERVAVISYLSEHGDSALELWERGWPHKSRPSLPDMLSSIKEMDRFDPSGSLKNEVRNLVRYFNTIVHADPAGLLTNIGVTPSGVMGYLSGANLNDPEKCDHICQQTIVALSLLLSRAAHIFPDAIADAKH